MIYSKELKITSKDATTAVEQLKAQLLAVQRETQQELTLQSTENTSSYSTLQDAITLIGEKLTSLETRIEALEGAS